MIIWFVLLGVLVASAAYYSYFDATVCYPLEVVIVVSCSFAALWKFAAWLLGFAYPCDGSAASKHMVS